MDAEALVRQALSSEFGVPFAKTELHLGKTLTGTKGSKRFDAASPDHKVVAMVKGFPAGKEQGNLTRKERVIQDLYFLSLVLAERRFMYLSGSFYEWLKHQSDAVIADGIEVRIIPAGGASSLPITSVEKQQKVCQYPPVDSIVSVSKRYHGQYYLYWWDIWPSRKEALAMIGQIRFIKNDTGKGFAVKADDLLPLLTEERRTSRTRDRTGGNWGIRVLAVRPHSLVIEEPGVKWVKWLVIPAKRI
ncbi:MAG: hypothetical protein HWN68_13680 [Desulfobacterales bacterium]|nr:hypothetical protein [Desulfobacterales bacterium]